MKKKQIFGSLLLVLTATIWGCAFVAQSIGMDYVGPFTFTAVRSLIGSAFLVPCILLLDRLGNRKTESTAADGQQAKTAKPAAKSGTEKSGTEKFGTEKFSTEESGMEKSDTEKSGTKESRKGKWLDKDLLTGGLCCGILICVASNLQQYAIQYASVGKSGFLTALYIVIVPVLGIFAGKKPGRKLWAAVVLALAGLYLLCMKSGSFGLQFYDIILIFCALTFSFHILVIDHFSARVDGVRMSCIQFLVCGLISLIPALMLEHPSFAALQMAAQPILYTGIFSCGVAYTLQIIGQKDVNPVVASLIMSLESVISAIAGWILLGETLSGREICGCVIMFAAIILATVDRQPDSSSARILHGKKRQNTVKT